VSKQAAFRLGKVDCRSVSEEFGSAKIHAHSSKFVPRNSRFLSVAVPQQKRLDADLKIIVINGFQDAIIGPRFEETDTVGYFPASQDDHWKMEIPVAQLGTNLYRVNVGFTMVYNDKINIIP
jgi:hypothetical protein